MSQDIERAAEVAAQAIKCPQETPPCGDLCDCHRDAVACLNALLAAGYQIIPPIEGTVT